jgi:hypothetical protein
MQSQFSQQYATVSALQAPACLKHVANKSSSSQSGEFFRLLLSQENLPHILQHFMKLLQFKPTNAHNVY